MSENTLEVTFESRIDKSTDRDSTRYALGDVLATPAEDGKVFLTATDSRILAIVEADGMTEQEQQIPAAVVPKRKTPTCVQLNGQWDSSDGKFCPVDPNPRRFPPCAAVLQSVQADYFATVSLDAKLLQSLSEALGANADERGVTLFIPQPDKEGRIDSAIPVLGRLGIGVIMPFSSERAETDRKRYQDISDRYLSAREAVK